MSKLYLPASCWLGLIFFLFFFLAFFVAAIVAVGVAVAIVAAAAVAANWRVIGCSASINLLFYTRLPCATRRMSNVSAKQNAFDSGQGAWLRKLWQ